MAKILIVDDEARIRSILRILLECKNHVVDEAENGIKALSKLEKKRFDLVISDIRMDEMSGMELLSEIKNKKLGCPVIFITAYASVESSIEALRLGASDYLVKPFDEDQVYIAIERALSFGKVISENVQLQKRLKTGNQHEKGLFVSRAMKQVEELAMKVARTDATVLITGESGVGKEVVANFVHANSNRMANRFVPVNCAAISPSLMESELFGYEKGAFTGASTRTEGKFEFANNGTLFLDEVGDLPHGAQAKLLRAIQEKAFSRVGGNREIELDIRLICATNQNLEQLVAEKKFRQDLYYRLAVFPIEVPPLRERKEAIIPLAVYFIRKYGKTGSYEGDMISKGAQNILKDFSWPGNVRELANAIERVMILKSGKLPVTSDDLTFLAMGAVPSTLPNNIFKLPPSGIDYDGLQKEIVQQVLDLANNNQSSAARLLGLSRARFRTLMKMIEDS
jgi:DNA-binding NtrC family response regulator